MSPVRTRARLSAELARGRLAGLLGVHAPPVAGSGDLAWAEEPEGRLRDLIPAAVRNPRTALDHRGAATLAVVAALAVALAGWFAWRSASVSTPGVASVHAVGATALRSTGAGAQASRSPVPRVVVDVAGRVRRPGLVQLPTGARVADALAAAGGALPGVDLATLNLAQPLTDGQQIVVGSAAAMPGGAGAPSGSSGAVVDLNTATVDQLDALPGVGPVLAQRILDWRMAHGRFSSVDELGEVGGIGART